MKYKMMQLLSLFLLISLFSSSKENKEATVCCKINQCIKATVVSEKEPVNTAKEENTEYPVALAPGNYMFRY